MQYCEENVPPLGPWVWKKHLERTFDVLPWFSGLRAFLTSGLAVIPPHQSWHSFPIRLNKTVIDTACRRYGTTISLTAEVSYQATYTWPAGSIPTLSRFSRPSGAAFCHHHLTQSFHLPRQHRRQPTAFTRYHFTDERVLSFLSWTFKKTFLVEALFVVD